MAYTIEQIKQVQANITYQDSFNLAIKCSKLLNSINGNDKAVARNIIIHILDKIELISKETYPIWADIIEAAGFYPYLIKNAERLQLHSFSDLIRAGTFISDYLPNTSLHYEQKKLADFLKSGINVVASAPTSFGKSLLIEELVASHKYKNIVIIQPTLALLDETRLRLKKYDNLYKIIVRTSQRVSEDEKGNLFLLTAERVMEYEPLPVIDLLIIDEFYKMSLRRVDDRASILNNAFLKIMNANAAQFYLLGPNIDGITKGFAEKYNALFYKTDFSIVSCNVIDYSTKFSHNVSNKKSDKEKLPILFSLLDDLKEQQTIIYCASPIRARKIAREYLKYIKQKGNFDKIQLPLIEWINNNFSKKWSLAQVLEYGVAIHDGSLQKHISNAVISYFNSGKLRCIFCTSTIIEGVNTSAKNVIIYDGKKGGKYIDYFDYSNICGRSGRLMEHYVGNVYNFVPKPAGKEFIVDIPFIEQDEKLLTNEILVNIKEAEVKEGVRDRYTQLTKLPKDLLSIIKQNGVNIIGQLKILKTLELDIENSHKKGLITWTQYPNFEAMLYVLNLCNNNLFDFKDKHGVFSVKHLACMLCKYQEKKNIMSLVKDNILYKLEKKSSMPTEEELTVITDNTIEECFHVYRHWFQFKVPKAFRVVDSLQRYICENKGINAGSYSFYVQQLENDFLPERLSFLLEYGIPNTTILKIESLIPDELIDEEIIEFIREHKNIIFGRLTQYEIERIDEEL